MNKFLISILLLALSINSAFAITIGFTMEEDAADFPWIGREFAPGIVTGNLIGLPENGNGVFPTTFVFTSDVSAIGITSNLEFTPTVMNGTGFNVVNGVIVSANVLMNFNDPVNGGMQVRFNFDDWNVLHWNGGSGPVVGMGNQNGFSGATYGGVNVVNIPTTEAIPVPTMSNWALATLVLFLGLFGFWAHHRQRTG